MSKSLEDEIKGVLDKMPSLYKATDFKYINVVADALITSPEAKIAQLNEYYEQLSKVVQKIVSGLQIFPF